MSARPQRKVAFDTPAAEPRAATRSLRLAPAPARVSPKRPLASKDIPLEAIRGVAALSVVVWHSLLGIFPELTGALPQFPASGSLSGQPWFGLIYGTAAITLFFVLSGYVLTRAYFETYESRLLLRGAIKRWPRLVGPVFVAVMASWALFALHAFRHQEAAALTGSPWLAQFGSADATPFQPSLFDALRQGLVGVFLTGDCYYDSSLWTMRYEFSGSFLVFGLAAILGYARKAPRWAILASLAVLALALDGLAAAYLPFLVGAALAFLLPPPGEARPWPAPVVWGAVGLAIYLFGYSGKALGAYGWTPAALSGSVSTVHVPASALLISAIEFAGPRFRARLGGPISKFLGALSFPVYLVHVLVICSLGSALLVALVGAGWDRDTARAAAVFGTAIVSILAALPLLAFNEYWVGGVNVWTAGIGRQREAASHRVKSAL